MPLVAQRTEGMALADLTGDGLPEIVFANDGVQNRLFLNVGGGRFVDVTATAMPVDTDRSMAVVAGNFDDDPDVELMFAQYDAPSRGELYDLAATGYVRAAGATPPSSVAQDVLVHDLDGDGDLDAVLATEGFDALWWNLTAQADLPRVVRIGGALRLSCTPLRPPPASP